MKAASVPSDHPTLDVFSPETLATLANVYDEESHAVTLYFSQSTPSNKAHREEALAFEHLVKPAKDKARVDDANTGLSKDLEQISGMEAEFRRYPSRFKTIFACSDKRIWQEVDLPVCGEICQLEISQRFQIVPLLRALKASTPYCVALIEHGRARLFTVSGREVHEMNRLPAADLTVDAEDTRVGWSHHIDGNVRERAKAYLRLLARSLHDILQELSCQHLVVSCREDLWSELMPQLTRAGMRDVIAGRFHLSTLDMTPAEIVDVAEPIFHGWQRQQYVQFWESIREEKGLSAVGIEPVLRQLDSGRVQTIFLGDISGKDVTECANCHRWLNNGNPCPECGSSRVNAVSAEELIVRKALSTKAALIAPDVATARLFNQVGAVLRY